MPHQTPKLAAAALLAGLALAQTAAAQPRPEAELQPPPEGAAIAGVEVIAPKVIKRERYGVVEREYLLSVRVSYRDLDMATPQGAAELDRRVSEAADYACRQLAAMYPDGSPDTLSCERNAESGARPQVMLARNVR